MEYSSSKPLSLQVYKTCAEFKALRLNRTEQCRLKCTQSFIMRQERIFHKDFKMSKNKVETQFLRRFCAQEPGAVGSSVTPIPWSAAATPRGVSMAVTPRVTSATRTPRGVSASGIPASVIRRASETPSTGRASLWSLPDSLNKSRLLQKRRLTYAGGSARYPPGPRPLTGRHSVAGDKAPADCDLCDQISTVESHRFRGSNDQQEKRPMGQFQNRQWACPKPEASVIQHNGNAENSHAEAASVVSSRSEKPIPSEVVQIYVEDIDSPESNDLTRKEDRQPRATTPNSYRSRRRPAMVDAFTETSCSPKSISVVSPSRPNEKDSPDVKSEADSGVVVDHQELNEPGKAERKVCITQPSANKTSVFINTSAPRQDQPLPNPADIMEAHRRSSFQHVKNCPAAEAESFRPNSTVSGAFREMSVAFAESQPDSDSGDDEPELQEKVSNFLQEQTDFNKRFPLHRTEVESMENIRPDLFKNCRSQRVASAKTRSQAKQDMIAEVLEKLGMADETDNLEDNKRLFPPLR